MPKHIFVTGGVVSSLGKGVTSASIGMILERMGHKVSIQKLDPYINVDPGTMNPFQHGEVYVTLDGKETDLDIGHYERFTTAKIDRNSNYTTGQIYLQVINKEREGKYLGQTVQVIPHITNEIIDAMRSIEKDDIDISITEIGGTVGDIEGLPYLEAARQFALKNGHENTAFIHLTLIPFLRVNSEIKTKPTQQSVSKLREIGIQPNMLICRTEVPITKEAKEKISLFCNVPSEYVIEERNVEHSIYEIPLMLVNEGFDRLICRILGLKYNKPELDDWSQMIEKIRKPSYEVNIAVVGKYLSIYDSYKSIYEALHHGGIANECRINIKTIDSEKFEKDSSLLESVKPDGILIPGGFGTRGIKGKVKAIEYARKNHVPFFGICLGCQVAAIEYGLNELGLADANSEEFDKDTKNPVIHILPEQKEVTAKGATMRLGGQKCDLLPGTLARKIYGAESVVERHRHRFEFNNDYRKMFEDRGFIVSGVFKEKDLVEIVELKNHPWFIGVQFHPEFQSKPNRPHPLFKSFVKSCINFKEALSGRGIGSQKTGG